MKKLMLGTLIVISSNLNAQESIVYIQDPKYKFPDFISVSSLSHENWDISMKAVDSTWSVYSHEDKIFFASLGEDTSLMPGIWNYKYVAVDTLLEEVKLNEGYCFDIKHRIFLYENDTLDYFVRKKIILVNNDENNNDPDSFVIWVTDFRDLDAECYAINLRTHTFSKNLDTVQQRFNYSEIMISNYPKESRRSQKQLAKAFKN